jgi:hypothetical protein
MKKLIPGLVVLFVVVFCSCNKENDGKPIPGTGASGFIKSLTVADTTGIILMSSSYSYDSRNRLSDLTVILHSPGVDTLFYRFDYYTSKVVVTRTINFTNFLSDKTIYDLNLAGLARLARIYEYTQPGDSILELTYVREYDPEGYLKKKVTTYYGGSSQGAETYQLTNRNYTSVTWTSSVNGASLKENNFYDDGHVSTIGNANSGLTFLGKSSYNPIIRTTDDSTGIEKAGYSYLYDEQNRIRQVVVNGVSFGMNFDWYTFPLMMAHEIITYTYY